MLFGTRPIIRTVIAITCNGETFLFGYEKFYFLPNFLRKHVKDNLELSIIFTGCEDPKLILHQTFYYTDTSTLESFPEFAMMKLLDSRLIDREKQWHRREGNSLKEVWSGDNFISHLTHFISLFYW